MTLCVLSYGDQVYLKNGRVIEGSILTESAQQITLDIGTGTIDIPASDVLKIERQSVNPPKTKSVENAVDAEDLSSINPRFKWISDEYNKMLKARKELIALHKLNAKKTVVMDKHKKDMWDLRKKQAELERSMKDAEASGKKEELDKLRAEKYSEGNKIELLSMALTISPDLQLANEDQYNADLKKYKRDLKKLSELYEKTLNSAEEAGGLDKQTEESFKRIGRGISSLYGEFKVSKIKFIRLGGDIVVKGLINNQVRVMLKVGESAREVSISKEIADKIGVQTYSNNSPVSAFRSSGNLAHLEFLKLDGMSIKNVECRVKSLSAGSKYDGEFGIGFFRDKIAYIDAPKSEIVFESFNPANK